MNLKFGIMCGGSSFPLFAAICIRKLMEIDGVKPALLIIQKDNHSAYPKTNEGPLRFIRNLKHRNTIIYKIIKKIDNRYHKPSAWDPVSLEKELGQLPVIMCDINQHGKFSQYFLEEDIQKIKQYNLDFIIKFGFNIIRGEILNLARYGIWSFHHDDEQKYRGGPVGAWEIYYDDPVNAVVLQRLTEKLDGGIILKKGYFKTVGYSLNLNYDNVLLGSAEWPATVCKDIMLGNADYLSNTPVKTSAPIFKTPTNIKALLLAFKMSKNYISNLYDNKFTRDMYSIGVAKVGLDKLLKGELSNDIIWMKEIENNFFYADPFAKKTGQDELTILAEEYDCIKKKGRIVSIKFNAKKEFSYPSLSLELNTHISYPYLISLNHETFCIPENSMANRISLFRAGSFPDDWCEVVTLIEGKKIVDPTIIFHEDFYWLFCTEDSRDLELCIWFSKELKGPWSPHPKNPVKYDIRSARPAGNIFKYNNTLYRPSQNGSKEYGGGININKINILTTKDFNEEPIVTLTPPNNCKYKRGIHHLGICDEYIVIDGKRRKLYFKKLLNFIDRIIRHTPRNYRE